MKPLIRSIGRCASRRIFPAAWSSQSPSILLHLLHRGSRIKLITRLFYHFILNPVNTPLPDPFGRGYPRLIGCIHRYHAVGGANGTTMVVMFVDCCVCGVEYFPYYSYCRILRGGCFFVPAGTDLAVKLLKQSK